MADHAGLKLQPLDYVQRHVGARSNATRWWRKTFSTSAWKTTSSSRPTTRIWTSSIRTPWRVFEAPVQRSGQAHNICGATARDSTGSNTKICSRSEFGSCFRKLH